ncbi:hypothetical protein HaLaN_02884, partial [Haematococcus lacustris]
MGCSRLIVQPTRHDNPHPGRQGVDAGSTWSMLTSLHESPVKLKLLEKATARRTAHRVMAEEKHKKDPGKKQNASRSRQGKQRQERRDGWTTRRRQVIKV